MEKQLLEILQKNPGIIYSRKELLGLVIPGVKVLERTVDAHIRSIRKKLPYLQESLETIRGFGYRFNLKTSSPEDLIEPPTQ